MNAQLLVIAKEPVPGRSKTRLCPPCSPEEAAAVALASLEDTLSAVAATPARRRILVLDGYPGEWVPAGFEIVPQRGNGLGDRLDAAFADCGAPSLLIGMDTPQATPEMLTSAVDVLMSGDTEAVLGPTPDGGYWAIGFRDRPMGAFDGVPMSVPGTARAQSRRLQELGLRYELLEPLRDIDYWSDALAVARTIPQSQVARAINNVEAALERSS